MALPGKVQDITIEQEGLTNRVSWQAVSASPAVTLYEARVWYSGAGNTWVAAGTVSGSATNHLFARYAVDTPIYWILRAVNSDGNGPWPSSDELATPLTITSASIKAQNLTVTGNASSRTISWSAPSSFTPQAYRVLRDNTVLIASTTNNTYTDNATLAAGNHQYEIEVQDQNDIWETNYTATRTFTVSGNVGNPPSYKPSISVDDGDYYRREIRTNSAVNGGYVLHRRTSNNNGSSWTSWSTALSGSSASNQTLFNDTHTLASANTNVGYRMALTNSNGTGPYSDIVTFELEGSPSNPGKPRALTVTGDENSRSLSWSKSPDSNRSKSFKIERKLQGGTWSVLSTTTTTTSYTDSADLDDGLYIYRVAAGSTSSGGTYGPYSTEASIQIASDDSGGGSNTPSAPLTLRAQATSTGVYLSWRVPVSGNPTSYIVYRWTSGPNWTQIADTGSSATNYTDTAQLTPGRTYWYYVRGKNANGNGAASNTISIVALTGELPSAPRRLEGDSQSTGVELDWLEPSEIGASAIIGYEVWRTLAGKNPTWARIANLTTNASLYTDTDSALVEGKRYAYVVRARNSSGVGAYSAVVEILINPSLPSAPRNLTATELLSGTRTIGIRLDWQTPVDTGTGGAITGYEIWKHAGVSWTKIHTTGVVLTYTDPGPFTDGHVWYNVRAVNAAGTGEWGQPAGASVDETTPTAPQSFVAVEEPDAVELSWLEPKYDGGSPVTSYQLWRIEGTLWVLLANEIVGFSYTDSQVLNVGNAVYSYRLRARNANGLGDYATSNVQTGPNAGGFPEAPVNLACVLI